MPVNVNWADHCPRCVVITINGGWVWNDFHAAMMAASQLSESTDQDELEYIFDVRDARVFPRDVLHKIRRLNLKLHENANLMIVVGEGTFAQALIQLLETMAINSNTQITQVTSLDAAYTLIDDNLPSDD